MPKFHLSSGSRVVYNKYDSKLRSRVTSLNSFVWLNILNPPTKGVWLHFSAKIDITDFLRDATVLIGILLYPTTRVRVGL
jgi:hypothetical protein